MIAYLLVVVVVGEELSFALPTTYETGYYSPTPGIRHPPISIITGLYTTTTQSPTSIDDTDTVETLTLLLLLLAMIRIRMTPTH
jgi:hypothetical protein